MFKLVVVAGPNRGTSYAVQDGENSIGRQAGNAIVLQSSKISKRHCVLVASNGELVVRDEGSSNGTFVNGVLAKNKKVGPGDRISLGDYVLEVSRPKKKNSTPPAIAELNNLLRMQPRNKQGGFQAPFSSSSGSGFEPQGGFQQPGLVSGIPSTGGASPSLGPQEPKDLKGKLAHFFEHKLMPFFYGLNLRNEWKVLLAAVLAVFVAVNLYLTVQPLLQESRTKLVAEMGRRAKFMAKQIAERNAPYLAARAETKTEIGSIEAAEGVRVAALIDLDNRILAPGDRLNQYLTNGPEAVLAVKAKDAFRSGRETGLLQEVDSETLVAVEPVKILSPQAGKNIIVAMAVVSLDTSLGTAGMGEMGMVYSETMILTGALAILLFMVIYRMTLKPLEILSEDMDKALKGEIPQVTHEFKIQELNQLWDLINSAVQRARLNLGGEGGSGEAQVTVEDFAGPARLLGGISQLGVVLLDSEKKIHFLNSTFEEISGIRGDGAMGLDFSAVARDQSLIALVSDLLERASVGSDGVSEDYEFSGSSYKVHVSAYGTGSSGARAYLLVAAKAEE